MKVLFLDADGVLNNAQAWKTNRLRYLADPASMSPAQVVYVLDQACVDRVLYVLKETGAKVVLSSTWRGDPDAIELLAQTGILSPEHRYPVRYTTPFHQLRHRGTEIQEWLTVNPVVQYAIVDDDSDMLEDQLSRFVKTDGQTGLTCDQAHRLIHLLNQ